MMRTIHHPQSDYRMETDLWSSLGTFQQSHLDRQE